MGLHVVRWDKGGTEPAGVYTFVQGRGNENHQLGTRCFHQVPALKRGMFVSDCVSCAERSLV